MVDELGGFMAATQAAKTVAGIHVKQEVELVYYPRRKSLIERVSDALSGKSTDLPGAWQQVLRTVALLFEGGSLLTATTSPWRALSSIDKRLPHKSAV